MRRVGATRLVEAGIARLGAGGHAEPHLLVVRVAGRDDEATETFYRAVYNGRQAADRVGRRAQKVYNGLGFEVLVGIIDMPVRRGRRQPAAGAEAGGERAGAGVDVGYLFAGDNPVVGVNIGDDKGRIGGEAIAVGNGGELDRIADIGRRAIEAAADAGGSDEMGGVGAGHIPVQLAQAIVGLGIEPLRLRGLARLLGWAACAAPPMLTMVSRASRTAIP